MTTIAPDRITEHGQPVINAGGLKMSERNGDGDSSLEDKVDTESSDSDVLSLGEERMILERTAQSTGNRSGRRQSSLDVYLRESKPGIENYVLKSKESLHEKLEKVKEYETEHQLIAEDDNASARERKRLEICLARTERNEEKQRESTAREVCERRKSSGLPTSPRKGLGVLTREKKARLKQLILQKAKDDLRKEQRELLIAKETYLQKMCPPVDFGDMDDDQLREIIKGLYERAVSLESDRLYWEEKVQAQEAEMHRLVQGTQELRGRFATPVLRKVRTKKSKQEPLMKIVDRGRLSSTPVGMHADNV
ncbi:Troponin I, slow skeletal muscle [Sparganum proliferum]